MMKNSISYRGSIAWNLLDPPVASTRAYAKNMAINTQAFKSINFSAESPQMSSSNDSDFVFYWLISI